ncbi:helix-turn-helix domain-containing protein [Amycolatopsis sp. lyj-23]|uniref:helix-turn-helix domain-containing protein n=1 Tax=Amycolatopsis sp. lyj-23 TaxID=2789283 RepID=UPI00397BAC98
MASDPTPHTDDTLQHDLGAKLGAAREAAGLKQHDMVPLLGKTQPTVSKIERGDTSISREHLLAWITRCNVPVADADAMVRIWDLVNSPVRVRGSDRAPTPKWFFEAMEREQQANVLCSYSGEDIHGLMQHESYMLLLFDGQRRATDISERLKQRTWRQRILADPDKSFVFIISESALNRLCAQPADIVEDQLGKMVTLAQKDNVVIRYLRYSASPEAGPSYVMLRIPDDDVPVRVYNEHLTGVTWIPKRNIHTYETTWAAQLALAESAEDTLVELHRRFQQVTSANTKDG